MSRLSLDTVTIRYAGLEEKFQLTLDAGFDGIELWGEDVDTDQGVENVLKANEKYPLIVEGVCPQPDLYPWHFTWDDFLERKFIERLKLYQRIRARYLVLPVMSEDGDLRTTSINLNKIGDIAHPYGIKLGIEPIGHVGKLSKIEDAIRLMDAYSAKAEIGLILDAFHFFRGKNQISSLQGLDPKQILSVHIDDAMDLPIDVLVGYKHRVYPGEGIFDIRGFSRAIQRLGYDGPYVVELLNQAYWDSDPQTVTLKAYASVKNILG